MSDYTWSRTIPLLHSKSGQDIVREACETHGFSQENLFDLIEAEVEYNRNATRLKLFSDFDSVFDGTNSNVD